MSGSEELHEKPSITASAITALLFGRLFLLESPAPAAEYQPPWIRVLIRYRFGLPRAVLTGTAFFIAV